MTKEAKIYSGEKTASSINGAWKNEQLHEKESNCTQLSHYKQKYIQNGLKT